MSHENKLMEAAAEILSGSISKATAMPPQKLPTEVEDLGGPHYTDANPTDDSEKIDTAKGSKDYSAQNKASISMKPSNATGSLKKEEKEEAMAAIFENGTVSEEFKEKAAVIFEARLNDRVLQIEEEIETRYAGMLEEAVQKIQEDLAEKVNDYLSYVVEQWIEENQIAIETGLRTELAEDFISGLKNLFVEHYIDVPEEKVDLVNELSEKVTDLESKLNEEIERGIGYRKSLVESRKNEIVRNVCEGLVDTQVEKIKALAESVEFSTEDEYKEKLEIIRDSYQTTGIKKANASQLHENVDIEDKPIITDAFVSAVSKAISKTKL